MKIEIRNACEGDVDFIASLEKETFSVPQSRDDFLKMLDGEKHLLVAVCNGETAGYVSAYTVCRETDIMTVAVAPAYRKNGIGHALINALCEKLCGESDAIFLEVRRSNGAARRLYSSHGFFEVGVRKNYYKLPTEDAILYKKEL